MTTSRNASHLPAVQALYPPPPDLLARVGLGDQRALASLYDCHAGRVYSVALRVCRDAAVAEEVLQSVFMQLWLAPQQFDSAPAGLEGSLALLSRNLAIDLIRRRRSTQPEENSAPSQPPDPIRHTDVSRLMHQPHALVLLLPDADRRMLEMAFFEDVTPAQIAARTGFPAATIPDRLRDALSTLRSQTASPAATPTSPPDDSGLDVLDLDTDSGFLSRSLHPHNLAAQMEGLRRLTHSFVENPDSILQELVNAAVELCGADSAGISLETEEKSDANYYHWVATAGQYNGFLNSVLPRYPSACGICLERARPQLFRVRQRFFDIMGIDAPLVTDGILLPWQVGPTRGTIFIMAHGRTEAFDKADAQTMRVLADVAAMAIRHQQQQRALLQQATAAAAAAMANKLAHRINNPLQSLINIAYLAAEGQSQHDARTLGQELSLDLRRLSTLVTESLVAGAHPSPEDKSAGVTIDR